MLRKWYKSSPRMRRRAHRAKDVVLHRMVRMAMWSTSRLSLEAALELADRLGDAAFLTMRDTRRVALDHLAMVLGEERSAGERRAIYRSSLRSFARAFCELAKIEEIRPHFADYVEVQGLDSLHRALAKGRGLVVASAHLGNWELLAAYFAAVEKLPVAAVARRLDEPRLNAMLVEKRAASGVRTILRESRTAGRELLRVLKDNGVLAMLIDQDTNVSSVSVPFLGRPARTPIAPARLAVRRKLPIVVAYSLRRQQGGLRLVVSDELDCASSGDRDADAVALTARCNEILSEAIRAHPDQWPWWHRRWRRPPQAGLDADA